MSRKSNIVLLITVFLILNSGLGTRTIFAKEPKLNKLYVYLDHNGYKVYSQTKPATKKYQEILLPKKETTKWAKIPNVNRRNTKILNSSVRSKLNDSSTDKNALFCLRIEQKLAKAMSKLEQRLPAQDFDRTKDKLLKLRWEKRKRC
ncbi:hypothetical protein [Aliikangiella sp. G2MR2-5]|uniref:hypothetical protein n=1 Tax=Aliikangiella sp. G2MR2-5 TaxID=2788943 RepID=UPI0018ABBF57|nr:hypothetical protein [Aliikangiella sp. G2MR2-5]